MSDEPRVWIETDEDADWLIAVQLNKEQEVPGYVADKHLPRQAAKKARRPVVRLVVEKGYNPSQPRAPKGSPDGGQWVDDTSAAGGGQSAEIGYDTLEGSEPNFEVTGAVEFGKQASYGHFTEIEAARGEYGKRVNLTIIKHESSPEWGIEHKFSSGGGYRNSTNVLLGKKYDLRTAKKVAAAILNGVTGGTHGNNFAVSARAMTEVRSILSSRPPTKRPSAAKARRPTVRLVVK